MILHPSEVKSLGKYKIWLKYPDNTNGEIDLMHLANKGVFKKWESDQFFDGVYIDQETGAVA